MGSSRFIRGLTWLVVAAIMLSVASPALAAHRFVTGEGSLPPGVTRQSEQGADQSISSSAHWEQDSRTSVPPATASQALTAATQPTSTLALTTTGVVTPASPLAIGGAPDALSNVTPPILTVAADVGGLLLPVVTGGGLLVRAATHADDLAKVVSHGDEAVATATIGRQVAEEAVENAAGRAGRHMSQEVVEQAIRSEVKPARELARDRIPDTDVHHLIEKRFAGIFGVTAGDLPAIRLDRTFHQQEVTSRLFSGGLGLPTGGSYSTQQIWDAYVRVYGGELHRQDWLDAIWPYFERLGVQR